jgi:phosphoribosylanthranilate isomerase
VETLTAPAQPQIKICGLTSPREAEACAAAGADAIGVVSYPRSPRHIDDLQIRRITSVLPAKVCPVGVFANENFERIMQVAETGGLRAVQLHGQEPPGLVEALTAEGLIVIKALFVNGTPALEQAHHYAAAAFLVECAGGPLPGGNAMHWDWSEARRIPSPRPVILAGGLTPENIRQAIESGDPDAVDISSGVEIAPGRKDLGKVAAFCQAVAACRKVGAHRVFA